MLERIDKLPFFFTIDCSLCHNVLNVSHKSVEDMKGVLSCSLCGKQIKVPQWEVLVKASDDLNNYLSDRLNAKFFKLVLNPQFKMEDNVPAAAH